MNQELQTPRAKSLATAPTDQKWLTEYEVITRFNICKKTLDGWYQNKKLPRYQVGRLIFYKEAELNLLFEKSRKVIGKRRKKQIIPRHAKQAK